MTARADFNWVPIDQLLNASNPTTTVEFPIEENGTSSDVVDDAYLLIQAQGVSSTSHRIFVNNVPLPGIDLPSHSGWQTWMDLIPPGVLHPGMNTLRIDRIGSDNFRIGAAVVNWREDDLLMSGIRSDFNWVPINTRFSATNPTTTVEFQIEGEGDHGGEPLDDAYVLIDYEGVASSAHRVFINNKPLAGIDIPAHESGTATWVDRIRPGLLHKGENTIRIDRVGNDDFTVFGASINWREDTSFQVPRNIVHADFNWVPIKHTFTNVNPTTTVEFPIAGTSIVVDDGYLLIQAKGVSLPDHRVFINNVELPNGGLPSGSGWNTRVKFIPEGLLHSGTNSIRIDRIGNDTFSIWGVTVNWREHPAPISPS